MTTPPDGLQVLIVAHGDGAGKGDFPRVKDYVETVRNAFTRQETNELVRELSLVDEQGTGAAVRRLYVNSNDASAPSPPAAAELEKALHTLVVVFVNGKLLDDTAALVGLNALVTAVNAAQPRHGVLVLGSSEEVLSDLRRKPEASAFQVPQGVSVEKLGEYALRPAYAAMLALHKAHRLLSRDSTTADRNAARARFFISHAKLDGLPLAHSLSHIINQLPWLDQFYDARDIQSGDDFREVLQRGVLGSMLLVLRTDIYDLRFWCRQEVMWAEAYDRPVLLVDARTELLSRASVLGFTGVPGVRIPDGNLVRVLMEALREWVRIGVLHRRFTELVAGNVVTAQQTELLSRSPTLTSLAEAIKRLQGKAQPQDAVRVVHAEPPLESNHQDAAQNLIRSSFKNGAVLSFKNYLAQLP